MRIGLIIMYDPAAPDRLSGLSEAFGRQFARADWEIVPLFPERKQTTAARLREQFKRQMMRRMTDDGADRARRLKEAIEEVRARRTDDQQQRDGVLAHARSLSSQIAEQAREADVDVLFACLGNSLFFDADLPWPLVYYTDTTLHLAEQGYPNLMRRSAGHRAACREIEDYAMRRADAIVVPADVAARSAVADHGADPSRVFTVPLGANVHPLEPLDLATFDPKPPTRERLELLITARFPRRKRVGLAIEATHRLRDRGWNATLNYIGPRLRDYRHQPHVRCAGALQLSNPSHRRRHHQLIERSHVMILPSTAEAFGIAVVEAAHWGKPSIVSDAGGLPEAVIDGKTGKVVPVDASADAYADAVEQLVVDPLRYRRAARAALQRAQQEMTWDAWGDRVLEIIRNAHRSNPPERREADTAVASEPAVAVGQAA